MPKNKPKNEKLETKILGSAHDLLTERESNLKYLDKLADILTFAPESFLEKLKNDPSLLQDLVHRIQEKKIKQEKERERKQNEDPVMSNNFYG